jgi:hypothetical protein
LKFQHWEVRIGLQIFLVFDPISQFAFERPRRAMNDSSGGEELGSLAQSARGNQLKSARGILLCVGILTVIANVAMGFMSKNIIDKEIDAEIAQVYAQGMEVEPAAVEEVRESAMRAMWVAVALWCLTGVVFIVLGIIVYRFPIPVTITGLVLYVGCIAVSLILDPSTVGKGWIIKALITAGLFKAVQAAIAYEKENNASSLEPPPTAV